MAAGGGVFTFWLIKEVMKTKNYPFVCIIHVLALTMLVLASSGPTSTLTQQNQAIQTIDNNIDKSKIEVDSRELV